MDKTASRPHFRFRFVLLLLLAGLVAAGFLLYIRPLPALYPINVSIAVAPSKTTPLSWPSGNEAAVGALGYGLLATSGAQTPLPTASVAKVITALAVLKKYPLTAGESGPTLTLDDTDVNFYNQYMAEDGSVALVQSGEQITEYQALETMLLPSANNMADSLARWAYGSLANYSTAANQLVKSWGLTHTTVGSDASGFDPSTVSTASDLIQLGTQAMQNPVLAQIVGEPQATVPVAGTIGNTDQLLGQNGIVGIKTGNTDQAGGVFLSAAQQTIGGRQLSVLTAIMGAPDLPSALSTTIPLQTSATANFATTTLAKAGTVVGTYKLPWGGIAEAVTQKDVSLVAWQGSVLKPVVALNAIYAPLKGNASVGSLNVTSGSSTALTVVILKQQLTSPSWWWRIFHRKI